MLRFTSILMSVVVAGSLAACGGDDKSDGSGENSTPKGKADATAARAAQSYLDAYTEEDAKAVCELLAKDVTAQMEAQGGCRKVVGASLKQANFKPERVKQAYRDGDKATVTLDGSARQITLGLEGKAWKVVNGG